MKAITVEPKKPGTAKLEDILEPGVHEGSILVEAIAVAVCGTDVEIVEGKYGWPHWARPVSFWVTNLLATCWNSVTDTFASTRIDKAPI